MKKYRFKGLLTNDGWLEDVLVTTDQSGVIQTIEENSKDPSSEFVNGFALPGFQNAHSHAFQYAMAGMAELHSMTGQRDDFWSWRKNMYELALKISPEQLEDVASMLYAEMVRHGYTSVAEFHYLHHDRNGKHHSNLAEMGERLILAAKTAGIKITLVPMYYQQGGFNQPAEVQQRRFISSTNEEYYRLLEASKSIVSKHEHAQLGMGIHSLRAVKLEDVQTICADISESIPFHIHIAEQLKEVDSCIVQTKQRPVEWLINNTNVTSNFHLVHATHLSDSEVVGIARSGARVVLCPTTEGNLGDGRFRLAEFQQAEGQWSIGTDSHVSLNPLEELRTLDYGQRIYSHNRDTFCTTTSGDSGLNAIQMVWKNGQNAMGNTPNMFFAPGQPLDAVVYDAHAPLLSSGKLTHLTNKITYSSDQTQTLGTIINGEWVVRNNQHISAETIKPQFSQSMKELWGNCCRLTNQ